LAIMKRLMIGLMFSTIALFADVSGRWSGSFDTTGPNGETKADSAYFVLTQAGNTVTGTVGPADEKQFPIKTGKIDGTKLTLEVNAEGVELTFDLTVDGETIRGSARGQIPDEKNVSAKVNVTRLK
jgi:hypothetical protein